MPAPPPLTTDTVRPFWDGLREERLMVQCCRKCARHVLYPRCFCPHCGTPDLIWVEVSGNGHIYTFTVAEVPVSPDFEGTQPQLLAIIELQEGVRLASTLVEIAPDDIAIGMAVEPVFDDTSFVGMTVLRFRPTR